MNAPMELSRNNPFYLASSHGCHAMSVIVLTHSVTFPPARGGHKQNGRYVGNRTEALGGSRGYVEFLPRFPSRYFDHLPSRDGTHQFREDRCATFGNETERHSLALSGASAGKNINNRDAAIGLELWECVSHCGYVGGAPSDNQTLNSADIVTTVSALFRCAHFVRFPTECHANSSFRPQLWRENNV